MSLTPGMDFQFYCDYFLVAPALANSPSLLEFRVPLLPPSVNHFKVGRFNNSPVTVAYKDAVCIFSRKTAIVAPFYQVETYYFIPPAAFLRWDVDNFSKVAIDALKTAGVVKDDRYIVDHSTHKRRALTERDAHTLYIVRGIENL